MNDISNSPRQKSALPLSVAMPLLLVACVAVTTWWSYRVGKRNALDSVRTEAIRDLTWTASRLEAMFERAYRLNDDETLQDEVSSLGSNREFVFGVLTNENYQILHSMRLDDVGKQLKEVLPDSYKHVPVLQSESLNSIRQHKSGQVEPAGDERTVIAAHSLVLGRRSNELRPNRIGSLILINDYSPTRAAAFQVVTREALSYLVVTSLLSTGLGLFFHFTVARRLNRIARVAEQFGLGDTQVRTGMSGSDEVAIMAQSIDQMMIQKTAADREVKESEERYRGLFESTHDMVQSISPRGEFLFVNPAWKETLGYSDGDLSRLNMFDIIHPESVEHCQALFQSVLSGEEIPNVEAILIAKDGRGVAVEGNASPRRENGEVVATHGFFRDVTARKTAEKSLRVQERALESAVNGIVITDPNQPDNPIIYVNPAVEQMSGYSAEEVLGKNCRFLQNDDREQEALKELRTAIKAERECKVVLRNYRKDGTEFWNELSVSPVRDDTGKLTHFVGIQSDITERRQTERELRLRGQGLETAAAAMTFADLEGNLTYVNRAALQMWGYAKEGELIGRPVTDLSSTPKDAADVFEALHKDGEWIGERLARRQDGTFFPIQLSASTVMDENGQPLAVMGSAVDISEIKKAQETLTRLNDELEQRVRQRTQQLTDAQEQLVRKEKLATLGQLAGGVAHEIRNPMGVIRNAVYFLQQIDLDDEDAKDALGEVSRGLANSERIISELLDYARGPMVEASLFPLDEAITSALDMVRMPGNVEVERPAPFDTSIHADRGQIERLLANLIQNAAQAMPEGGTLTLRCEANDGHVVTEVSDTGVGIAADEQEKIFEPLFTKRAKGIGLGLPLCLRYAELNGGSLSVESKVGEGSTFRVALPRKSNNGA